MSRKNNEVLIKVEQVSKKFSRNLKKSLWYGLKDIVKEFLGIKSNHKQLRKTEFWAVKDISFELKRGECLGLIGRNGAGKSTLLKILSGLIQPDLGTIEMNGKVAALIELGAGFNPILTGRENIYINGAVLGFTKKEMDGLLEGIIEFSELQDFIDTPVQYYSSGMKVRLGFAVAVNLKPDILILDEVLAVGDAGFKVKSFNKITEMIQNAAVIFVSHSMPNISRISNKVLLMTSGEQVYQGYDTGLAISKYFKLFKEENYNIEYNKGAEITNLKINDVNQPEETAKVLFNGDIKIELCVKLKKKCNKFHINLQIIDKDLKIVSQFISNKFHNEFSANINDEKKIDFLFKNLSLIDGVYTVSFLIIDDTYLSEKKYEILAIYRNYGKFKVSGLNESMYASHFLMGDIFFENQKLLNRLEN